MMLSAGGQDWMPCGLSDDMAFPELYYYSSERVLEPKYFSESILGGPDDKAPDASGNHVAWPSETPDDVKSGPVGGMTAPSIWDPEQGAMMAGLGNFSPDWWCPDQPRQYKIQGQGQEQAAMMPTTASWELFGPQDLASSVPWPPCEGARDDVLAPPVAAPPLLLHDVGYPLFEGPEAAAFSPYPEAGMASMGWFEAQQATWPTGPFVNMPRDLDLEAQFARGLSLSEATELSAGTSTSCTSSPSASSSLHSSIASSASSTSSIKGKPPSTKSRSARSRKRLPSIAPDAAAATGVEQRRSSRLSHKRQARDASPSASSSTTTSDPDPDPDCAASYASSVSSGADGPPFQKIEHMSAADRAFLETTLLRDRDPRRAKQIPYTVIMRKLRHLFAGAEETLRGHYRKLVLPKEQRVRRPVWKPYDIVLLASAVQQQQQTSLRRKISWTAVSQHMHQNGASYRFGITACSRKWRALQSGRVD